MRKVVYCLLSLHGLRCEQAQFNSLWEIPDETSKVRFRKNFLANPLGIGTKSEEIHYYHSQTRGRSWP